MEDEIKKAIGDYTLNEIYIFCKTKECDECPLTTGGDCFATIITESPTIPEKWGLETPLGHMPTKVEDEAKDVLVFAALYKDILKSTKDIFREETRAELIMQKSIEAAIHIIDDILK